MVSDILDWTEQREIGQHSWLPIVQIMADMSYVSENLRCKM